jgi:hypothetical protein
MKAIKCRSVAVSVSELDFSMPTEVSGIELTTVEDSRGHTRVANMHKPDVSMWHLRFL